MIVVTLNDGFLQAALPLVISAATVLVTQLRSASRHEVATNRREIDANKAEMEAMREQLRLFQGRYETVKEERDLFRIELHECKRDREGQSREILDLVKRMNMLEKEQ